MAGRLQLIRSPVSISSAGTVFYYPCHPNEFLAPVL
jgi:hypothetical protein